MLAQILQLQMHLLLPLLQAKMYTLPGHQVSRLVQTPIVEIIVGLHNSERAAEALIVPFITCTASWLIVASASMAPWQQHSRAIKFKSRPGGLKVPALTPAGDEPVLEEVLTPEVLVWPSPQPEGGNSGTGNAVPDLTSPQPVADNSGEGTAVPNGSPPQSGATNNGTVVFDGTSPTPVADDSGAPDGADPMLSFGNMPVSSTAPGATDVQDTGPPMNNSIASPVPAAILEVDAATASPDLSPSPSPQPANGSAAGTPDGAATPSK